MSTVTNRVTTCRRRSRAITKRTNIRSAMITLRCNRMLAGMTAVIATIHAATNSHVNTATMRRAGMIGVAGSVNETDRDVLVCGISSFDQSGKRQAFAG
jgi:hypothetical protein